MRMTIYENSHMHCVRIKIPHVKMTKGALYIQRNTETRSRKDLLLVYMKSIRRGTARIRNVNLYEKLKESHQ
jgi:hypothetical protein